MPFAVYAVNRASPQIFDAIEDRAFFFVSRANLIAQATAPIWRRHDYKVIAANMPHKVIGIAMLAHDALADAPNQANDLIARQKAVDIIERFEIIQVKIQNTPGFYR